MKCGSFNTTQKANGKACSGNTNNLYDQKKIKLQMKTTFISLFTITGVVHFKKHSLSSSFKVQQFAAGLEHPRYSPDLAPNNFQIFPKLICRSTVFLQERLCFDNV